jgi:hypothetical protein
MLFLGLYKVLNIPVMNVVSFSCILLLHTSEI